jgi:hypothetical protein
LKGLMLKFRRKLMLWNKSLSYIYI